MPRTVMSTLGSGITGLHLEESPLPIPAPVEVRVRVKTAGLNPVDAKILNNPQMAEMFGYRGPSGNGNDFAGVIDAVGSDVTMWKVGDEVFGGKRFFAQADYLVISESELLRKPKDLSWEVAGSLDIAGRTALASVEAIEVAPGDLVLVSAVLGGVGSLAAQLLVHKGVRVLGTAHSRNREAVEALGVECIAYDGDMIAQIHAYAPKKITAVLDNHGAQTLDLAEKLGVDGHQINSITDRQRVAQLGGKSHGAAEANNEQLAQLAELLASKKLRLDIDSVFPIERVVEAYDALMTGHVHGKIVLSTSEAV